MKWMIRSNVLRRLRKEQVLTAAELADKAGLSERTILGLEARDQPAHPKTVTYLAQALGVDPKVLVRVADGEEPRRSKTTSASARAGTAIPPPKDSESRLEALVRLERADGAPPAVVIDGEALPSLGAVAFQDVMTAFVIHEGERFHLTGTLEKQHGVRPDAAQALGARAGACARFHVLVGIGRSREPLGVTVHTRNADETKALQATIGGEIRAVVRVVVAPGDAPVFFMFQRKDPLPWTFGLERLVVAPAPKRKRKR